MSDVPVNPISGRDLSYTVHGGDFQCLEVKLNPGQKVISEKGALLWVDKGVSFAAKLGDGSEPPRGGWFRKVMRAVFVNAFVAAKRRIARESVFLLHFENETDSKLTVGLTTPHAGRVIDCDLSDLSGEIIAEKRAFLAATAGTRISVALRRKVRGTAFGGEGLVMQRITGDGHVFLHSYGSIVERDLRDETILVDTGSILAYQPHGIEFSASWSGGPKTMLAGGEGMFLSRLTGTGKVWIQSQTVRRAPRGGATPTTKQQQRRR